MNQQLTTGDKIRQKISKGTKLSKNEKNYIESLLPQKNGLRVEALLKSTRSRYRNFVYIFEDSEKAQKFFHEILTSQQYTKELGKYLLQVRNNLVYSIVRGRRYERVLEVIETNIMNKPILTAVLNGLNFSLDKLLKNGVDLILELKWNPDLEILQREKQIKELSDSLFDKKEEDVRDIDPRIFKKLKNEVCTLTKQELLNSSIKLKVKEEISLIDDQVNSYYLID